LKGEPIERFFSFHSGIYSDFDYTGSLFPQEGVATPPLVLHQLPSPPVTSFPTGTIPANNKRRQSAQE
jgi:hypothetical protein